jgi:hypothetical protein
MSGGWPTACPTMCHDTSRPVITRYGVCSLIHAVKLHAVTEHDGSSTCSQNRSNSALAVLHCFSSCLYSCRPIWSSGSSNTPPVMQSECHDLVHNSKSQDLDLKQVSPVHTFPSHFFCNLSFNNSFPWTLMYFMRYLLFFDKNLLRTCDVMYAACPTTRSASYLFAVSVFGRRASHQSVKHLWRVGRSYTVDTSFQKYIGSLSAPEGSVCVVLRLMFGCVRKICENQLSASSCLPSVRPSARNNSSHTGQILMKFCI